MTNWAGWLEELLRSTDANTVSNYALYVIAGLFAFSLFLLFINQWKTFTNSTPGLLTSIGILGTFVGVVIGLLEFNPSDIDASIELLLNGLKTAFITSLAGMAAAIIYRILGSIISPLHIRRQEKKLKIDVGPGDILKALTDQSEHLFGLHTTVQGQEQHFTALKQAIAGDEESSLAGQMKLIRSDANDNHRNALKAFDGFSSELWRNLDNLSKVLAESATAQIVDALEKAITNFNEELREQFGENFKALDASVEKLVTWQKNYGQQVKQMTEQYGQGVKAIDDVKDAVATIGNETKAIPDTMGQLKEVLQTNQHQIQELSRHLEAFKAMRDQAISAIPEMQKHVESTVNEIAKAADEASKGYQSLVNDTSAVQETFVQELEEMQKALKSTVNDLVQQQTQEMDKHFAKLEQQVIDISNKSGESLNTNVERIDKALEQEMNQVFKLMGERLAGISRKFADDYERLTKEMGRVVSAARV